MDQQKIDIAVIGECLIELSANGSLADTSTLNKYFGGDTVTTAVAIARLGGNVTYLTKVGNDGFSEFILSSLQKENIDTSLIKTNEEQNGMYIVSHTLENKEVLYYKRKTAATKLSIEDLDEEVIKKLKLIYSTGVVQSLSASSRELIRESFRIAKENDVLTAYDPNYTSCFMNSADTKEYFEEIIDFTDIVFLSLKNDAVKLYEIDSIDKIMNYMWDKGVKIVVIKSHIDNGYYTGYKGDVSFTEFYNTQRAIDITASGDVFNGAFLQALTNGYAPADAAKFAAVVSGLQTQNYGAIQAIPYKDTVMEII
ncbi:MAG: sugar kinase [Cyanobacteria bacterium SIG28]|nr:sugar kinase [Cyanobacteria bacterium SIG28]